MNMRGLVVALAGCLLAPGVSAESPAYRYIDLLYTRGDVEIESESGHGGDVDQDGIVIDIGYNVGSVFFSSGTQYLTGDAERISVFDADFEITSFDLVVGWTQPLTGNTNLDLFALYRYDEYGLCDYLCFYEDAHGPGAGIGIRTRPFARWEFSSRVAVLSGDFDDALQWQLAMYHHVTEAFSVVIRYDDFQAEPDGLFSSSGELTLTQAQFGVRVRFP